MSRAYAGPADPGQRLADIGWRIGAVLVWVGGLIRAGQVFAAATSPPAMRMRDNSDLLPLIAVFSGLLAFGIGFGLCYRQAWARWVMIVVVVIAGIMLAHAGQTSRGPGGPVAWYAAAAGLVASWILLLERPTNPGKLAAGIILVILAEAAIFLLPMWEPAQ